MRSVRVIGLAMVRNEQDVIEHVVRHMLSQVDQVVVADNLSTDQTREILDSIADKRLVVVDDLDPAYRQSEKMTALANDWAAPGDWVVPFDADELWGMADGQTLAEGLRSFECSAVVGRPFVHVPQSHTTNDNCPFAAMPWRRTTPEFWPKAALCWAPGTVIEQGNHWTQWGSPEALDIRHFQYRSYDQLVTKVRAGAAALALAPLPASSGAHWRQLSAMTDDELSAWWRDYTQPQDLILDAPWCRA